MKRIIRGKKKIPLMKEGHSLYSSSMTQRRNKDKVVEELMGAPVENDSQMFLLLREYAQAKMAWDNIRGALEQAETDDYGIVAPR